ncbi:MAG: BatA domain-containing protein, partial [Nitrospinae bacterium]|nr:BatA domain-containing protein [Nitrospinota bacterium]
MNFIPSLPAWGFAVAGLACAAGPILIHLLNRRRFRTVNWAAMDFLRQALQRNRRMLEMRDIAILALRTLAVLLFGLALAQPYVDKNSILMWSMVFPAIFVGVLLFICTAAMWRAPAMRLAAFLGGAAAFAFAAYVMTAKLGMEDTAKKPYDGSQPLHAVLVIDNSMSMAYALTGETILARAKAKASEFIKQLPEGSQVSIIPLCGSQAGISPKPIPKEEAESVLNEIEVVDRSSSFVAAVNAAKRASELETKLDKRIVLIGDQQMNNWRGMSKPEQFTGLPEMQVVSVAP